jgi:gamma-glutamylputrescine oxidase
MLSPGVGQSVDALVRRFGHERARDIYFATLQAVRDAAALAAQLDCELALCGQLIVARRAAHRLERLKRTYEALGLPHEVHANAVRLPVAGTLHPGKLLAGLTRAVSQLGGVIYEHARVHSISTTRPVQLALDGGEVIANEVIVATAGYTPHLGVLSGRVLPVHLQVAVTEPAPHLTWPRREGVLDARRIFSYWRLTADDRIVFGGGRPLYRWRGSTAQPPLHARLGRELHHVFPDASIAGGWSGVIGYVADALPAVERWVHNPSVVHAVGWCGHGVALSLASGAWVASMVCDGAAPHELPWFRALPPKVPFEAARWLGFRATVAAMSLMDRLEAA